MQYLLENLAQRISPEIGMLLIDALLIYIGVVWVAILIWAIIDIFKRSRNPLFILLALLLVIVGNIFGLIIYLIIRPSQTVFERRLAKLEYEIIAQELKNTTEKKKAPLKKKLKPKPKKKSKPRARKK